MDTHRLFVIWSRDSFAAKLRKEFGEGNVLCSESEAREALNSSEADGLIVLAELDWDGRSLSELYGIEFVKSWVRAHHKNKQPILFVSFLDLAEILRRSASEIILAVGHEFENLPNRPEKWREILKSAEPLTDLQLVDVTFNLCNLKGLIGEIIHRIKGEFRTLYAQRATRQDFEEVFAKGLDDIIDLLGQSVEHRQRRNRILGRFRSEVLRGDSELFSFLDRCAEELKSFSVEGDVDKSEIAIRPNRSYPWKVLVLDDEPESLPTILDSLNRRGIPTLITQSVSEAEGIIGRDFFNEIVVAVSDYRLLESYKGITRQQRKQGYDFLFELATQDRFTGLVALSGLGRKFLLDSFRHYNTRIEIFSKDDLRTPGAIRVFADRIERIGNEVYDSLCSQPLGKGWRTLRPFYIAHRQSDEYRANEQEISDRARRYVLRISKIFKSNRPDLFLNPSLEKLDNLQSDLAGKDPYSDSERMEMFKNKLVGRRIALWLYLVMDFDRSKIFAALNGMLDIEIILDEIKSNLRNEAESNGPNWAAEIDQNAKKRLENRIKPLFNNLALSLTDFPMGILAEEKKWFKYEMGIDDIYEPAEQLDQTFYFVQVGIERFLEGDHNLGRKLLKTFDLLTEEGQPNITSLGDARIILSRLKEGANNVGKQHQFRKLVAAIIGNIQAHTLGDDNVASFVQFLEELVPDNLRSTS